MPTFRLQKILSDSSVLSYKGTTRRWLVPLINPMLAMHASVKIRGLFLDSLERLVNMIVDAPQVIAEAASTYLLSINKELVRAIISSALSIACGNTEHVLQFSCQLLPPSMWLGQHMICTCGKIHEATEKA